MDLVALATIVGTAIGVLAFLYIVFIGQKSIPEVLQERRQKRTSTPPPPPQAQTPPDSAATQPPDEKKAHAPQPISLASLIGRTLGPYRITEQIGIGGMATVYKAYQPSMDRHVAIKILPHNLSQNEQFIKRFEREAKAIAKLEHAHILPAYDFGESQGVTFIAMRLVEGGTLKDRITRGPMPLNEINRIMGQVGSALDYAHSRGIIHRDIKPSNILIDSQDDVFLGDFGLARLIDLSQHVTGSSVMGTPAYMSPEQGQGFKADHRSDIYSLGVVLYEMATGRLPYDAETPMGIVLKHIRDPLPLPRTIYPELLQTVEDVIVKAMEKDPNVRYQTVAEMITALADAAADGAVVTPKQPSAGRLAVSTLDTPIIARTPSDQLPPFIVGPPIIHPGRFFGRERELKRLFNLLKQPPLQNAAIIGQRRSGKTSLLHYLRGITTAAPEQLRAGQRADWLPEPGRYQWILVDFQNPQFGTRSGLLSYLLASLNLPAPAPPDLDRFIEVISGNLRSPTVILFDEVGVALQRYRAELDNAFWESLRALATNMVWGNLGFVLASHEPPDQLAQHSALGSPFFNIFGYTAALGPLAESEARALIASSPAPFPAADADWILAQSGRWPILLQILCRERLVALEEGDEGEGWREDGLKQMNPFRYLLESK